MATITGEAGASLTQQLANYLNTNAASLDTAAITSIINSVLPPNEQLGNVSGGVLSFGIYKRFGAFDVISNKVEVVTEGVWSNGSGSLTTFFTGSTTTISGHSGSNSHAYYYNVYAASTATGSSESVEFAVAYGHKFGSGSVQLSTSDAALLPTKANYSQYRILLNNNFEGEADEYFTFYSGSVEDSYQSEDIYVINISRANYRQQLDAGNLQLKLSGSNGIFTFIDDSGKKFSDKGGKAGSVFNIVSGNINLGTELEATIKTPTASNGRGYGKFYPNNGIIVLNPTALTSTVGSSITPVTTAAPTTETYNHRLLLNSIKLGAEFQLRRTEKVSTQHFFVRATNREFNFSNNPTFVSGSDGSFREPSFEDEPRTFITSIGLYNDANELVAVAKTSQPIAKSFDKEVLVKVKLDF
jgi:hypothetical protein